MKIQTKYNGYVPFKGSRNSSPSKTVPDQTMSIQELLRKYVNGQPVTGYSTEPVYNGEDYSFPDMTYWDLADREEFINARRAELEDLKRSVNDAKNAAKAAKKALLATQLKPEEAAKPANAADEGKNVAPHAEKSTNLS